jgi:iron-sulfur cluster assembly protein
MLALEIYGNLLQNGELAMAVSITEKAAAEVTKVKTDQNLEEGTFLRIGVVGGGCSGFSYSLKFESEFDESSDNRYSQFGVDVVVDKKSALYLDGTVVDWYDGLDRRGFTFENPNAVKSCGCGSSFQA